MRERERRREILIVARKPWVWVHDEKPDDCRYDCRQHLHSLREFDESSRDDGEEQCPTEKLEEDMCDEERYKDLYEDMKRKAQDEEREKRRRNEFAFSYDSSSGGSNAASSRLDEEEDMRPYEVPEGLKLPVGITTPDTMKLNSVIERTAQFVVSQGPQMEVVIRAKQRNNPEQFGFLEFDNPLNSYYKYMMKQIREGKYKPGEKKREVKVEENGAAASPSMKKPASSSALAAIAAEHGGSSESGSDDSDSDTELHPSLFAKRRPASPDPVEKGVAGHQGPKRAEPSPPRNATPPVAPKVNYRIEKANDMYASLFKNLSQYVPQKEKEEETEEQKASNTASEEFNAWYKSFFGTEPAYTIQPAVPPPPDMEPLVNQSAEYVAKNGPRAETVLKQRSDLQVAFLSPTATHHSYYLSRVRYFHWLLTANIQRAPGAKRRWDQEDVPAHIVMPVETTPVGPPPPVQTGPRIEVIAPPPPMNRKQRRRGFQDGPRATVEAPTIIDPINTETSCDSPLMHSPAAQPTPPPPPPPPGLPAMPLCPVSFSIAKPPMTAQAVDLAGGNGLERFGDKLEIPEPPLPPSTPTGGSQEAPAETEDSLDEAAASTSTESTELQIERKEKARLFMEKILNDKRLAKKRQEEEEERAREELRQQKADEERRLQEERERPQAIVGFSVGRGAEPAEPSPEKAPALKGLASAIDELIFKQMDQVFAEKKEVTPPIVESKKEEKKKDRERDRDRDRDRHKKEHRRRRDSSSDDSRERKRRRRSRSRSDSRDRHRRHRR